MASWKPISLLLCLTGMLPALLQARDVETVKVQVFSAPPSENATARSSRIQQLPLDAYVRGVLPAEMPEDFPLEALKAQAVLIRTYALSHQGRHQEEGFDFCGLTHCQAYENPKPSEKLEAAVRQTRGVILSYDGKPAETLYHSTCGGHTSANQKVFGGRPLPYLQGVADGNYCAASPHATWRAALAVEELSKILRQRIDILQSADREPEGRSFTLMVTGPKIISVEDFLSAVGRSLGWNLLKSNWFDVSVKNGMAKFQGHGLGHGVGLCQWGAKGMAETGKGFREILSHYFPGTRINRL